MPKMTYSWLTIGRKNFSIKIVKDGPVTIRIQGKNGGGYHPGEIADALSETAQKIYDGNYLIKK